VVSDTEGSAICLFVKVYDLFYEIFVVGVQVVALRLRLMGVRGGWTSGLCDRREDKK
jgi:hypothetical protein